MQLTLKKQDKPLKPIPPKKVFNLAEFDKKKVSIPVVIAIFIVVLVVIFAFAKFAVIDRFAELDRAQAEAASLQAKIDANYAKISELQGITDEYAHYTYPGMTPDELALVSRVDVMDLISRDVLPYASLSNWTLQGNTLNMTIYNTTLASVNQIVAYINTESIVNYSFVQTAATDNYAEVLPGSEVTAQITIYLQIPPLEEESTAEEVTE